MDVVYPKVNCVVAWSQGTSKLSKTKPVAADHQLVQERPDLFGEEPTRVLGDRSRIERATRAPGERRGRPAKDDGK